MEDKKIVKKIETPAFNERAGILVQDHILIRDKDTKREIVNKRA